jgi:disulfide bond formation protein DsbB
MNIFVKYSRHIALLTAIVATTGSLYFSLGLGWIPCDLCWYQRILMYPLMIIIAVNILRNDKGFEAYVLPFSILGIVMSGYHYLLQKTDWFTAPVCISGIPCSGDYLNWFGVITIPLLALTAFVIITIMALVSGMGEDDEKTAIA